MTKEKWFNQLQCEPLFPLGNTLTNEMTNTQRQKYLVGVSALPTGKFLRVQKVFARRSKNLPGKAKAFDCLKGFGVSGKF